MTVKNGVIEDNLVPDRSGESRKWLIPYCTALFAMTMLQISNMGFTPLMPGIQGVVGIESFTGRSFHRNQWTRQFDNGDPHRAPYSSIW